MNDRERRAAQRQRQRRRERSRNLMVGGFFLLIILFVAQIVGSINDKASARKVQPVMNEEQVSFTGAPPLDVQLLTVNEYSRPATAMTGVKGIVIHYTANPGSTAQNNRNYFEGLKDSKETKASSHFIVGLGGEVIQCIPSNEISYASNDRNSDTISIETCHPDESGQYNEQTYKSLVELTGWLCERFSVTREDVIRHYDVTGKDCPKYFVEHEDEWEKFKQDVESQIEVVRKEKEEKGEK